MKKIVFPLSVLVMGLMSCQSHTNLIQPGPVTVMTQDSSKLWIHDSDIGKNLYQVWKSGKYGPGTKVYLVDSNQFNQLRSRVYGYPTMMTHNQ